jgi:hypothetical protein
MASRDEGRPDFTGTVLAVTGAGTEGAALAGVEFTGALVEDSTTAAGGVAGVALAGAFFTAMGEAVAFLATGALAAAFAGAFRGAFTGALAGAFADVLTVVVAGFFATGAGLGAAFTGALTAGLALLGVAASGATLAVGFAMGLALAWVGLALVAFTAGLLTETRCAGTGYSFSAASAADKGAVPSARECTGFATGNPIICKSATNMRPPEVHESPGQEFAATQHFPIVAEKSHQ